MARKWDVRSEPQNKLFLGEAELTYATTKGDFVKGGEVWTHHVYTIENRKG